MKRLTALLATSIGVGALLLGASPADAAPQQGAIAAPPSTTTPDGKSLALAEFVGTFYAALRPAQAGDSAWTEVYRVGADPIVQGKVTATADSDLLTSRTGSGFFSTLRACAETAGTVTCTAWNRPV